MERLYDSKGNDYEVGQIIKLVDDISFLYDIGYKNKIILDFMDYAEEKLLIPSEYLTLPSIRTDFAGDKFILYWVNKETGETFNKYEKILADKNKTFIATYDSKYYPIKLLLFNNKETLEIIKYGNELIIPKMEIPSDIHLIGWRDQLSNEEYNNKTETISIEKEYFLKGIFVGYVNYYIGNKLIYQKYYDINSSFSIISNVSEISDQKILGWKDKNNNVYNSSKECYMEHDIDLHAIIEGNSKDTEKEEEESNSTFIALIVIIIISVFIIIVFLLYRYFRRKNIKNTIEEKPKKNSIQPEYLNSINEM